MRLEVKVTEVPTHAGFVPDVMAILIPSVNTQVAVAPLCLPKAVTVNFTPKCLNSMA